MARIAIAGFHHETNSFVAETTDFAYFASHRDRPPLVWGDDVLSWLGDTSFALSGFLADTRGTHDLVPLLWTSGGAGGRWAGRCGRGTASARPRRRSVTIAAPRRAPRLAADRLQDGLFTRQELHGGRDVARLRDLLERAER